jgi:hypothetical protein
MRVWVVLGQKDIKMSVDEVCEFDDIPVIRTTDAALLVNVDGAEEWIPKSQLQEGNEVEEAGDCGKLIIPRWLAAKKGWA